MGQSEASFIASCTVVVLFLAVLMVGVIRSGFAGTESGGGLRADQDDVDYGF